MAQDPREKRSREPRPEIKDLRRRLVLLDRLRGRPLRAAEGLILIDLDADDGAPTIRDPKALYDGCADGWPATATIAAAVALAEPP
ncbi:MAG: hypothetical protein KC486_30515, partial [Myxococcales bacterium]|nr:hypothetical protein [Myxococcales bacterium]